MTNQLFIVLIASAVLNIYAFKRGFLERTKVDHKSLSLNVNKIDGIPITGDLTPVSNNLFVQVKEIALETSGGLFIPETATERPTEGKEDRNVDVWIYECVIFVNLFDNLLSFPLSNLFLCPSHFYFFYLYHDYHLYLIASLQEL